MILMIKISARVVVMNYQLFLFIFIISHYLLLQQIVQRLEKIHILADAERHILRKQKHLATILGAKSVLYVVT